RAGLLARGARRGEEAQPPAAARREGGERLRERVELLPVAEEVGLAHGEALGRSSARPRRRATSATKRSTSPPASTLKTRRSGPGGPPRPRRGRAAPS